MGELKLKLNPGPASQKKGSRYRNLICNWNWDRSWTPTWNRSRNLKLEPNVETQTGTQTQSGSGTSFNRNWSVGCSIPS